MKALLDAVRVCVLNLRTRREDRRRAAEEREGRGPGFLERFARLANIPKESR